MFDGVWKYESGDNYELKALIGYKRFFELDLVYAEAQLATVMSYEKWGLPGFRWSKLHAEMAVEDSKANLLVVERAIGENS